MSLGSRVLGFARFGLLFVVGSFFILACADSRNRDDDDEEDGGGGTSASGGTGGTLSRGGTGPGSSGCSDFCQRQAACPEDPDPTCLAHCREIETITDQAGCSAEFDRLLACFASIDVCNPPENACGLELLAADTCVSGGSSAGCAPSGAGPANADCVAACQRVQACPGASQSDCALDCSQGAELAAMYGCTVEYNRLNGCYSTCTDICALTASDCPEELVAYSNCFTCAAQPSNPDCTM